MSRPYIYLVLTFFAVLVSSFHPFDIPPDVETPSATPEESRENSVSRN